MNQYLNKLNESLFGNDVYDGKEINIPDDFAIWCMNFYAEQTDEFYDFTKIPKNIISASKKLLNGYNDNVIYRGFGVDGELPNKIIFQPPKNGISWTFDEDTARSFSEKYENMGLNPFIAIVDFRKLKYVVSMDVVMDNITQDQVRMLSNKTTLRYMEDYVSESEILVFDTVIVNKNDINPLWESSINESPIPLEVHKEKTYYHGTRTTSMNEILKTHTLIGGNLDLKNSRKHFKPQYNKVYITPHLDWAVDFATSVMAGHQASYNKSDDGYICVIDGNDLKDIHPDEDFIAGIFTYFSLDNKKSPYFNKEYLNIIYKDNPKFADELIHYIIMNVSEKDIVKAKYDFGYGTVVAKKLIKNMDDETAYKFLQASGSLAETGEVPIKEIWKLPKEKDLIHMIQQNSMWFKHYSKLIWKR